MTSSQYREKVRTYQRRIKEAVTEQERMFFRRELEMFMMRNEPNGNVSAPVITYVHTFAPGDRVMSKATRTFGHVDRIIPNGHGLVVKTEMLIIITDAGQTIQDHPGHVEYLREPTLTYEDTLLLDALKVRW